MKSTFSIIFYLKRQVVKKDGTVPVMGRITVDGTQAQFSCKVTANPKLWDTKGGRMTGKSMLALEVNRKLDKMRVSINKHYQEILDRDNYVTAEKVKNAFLGLEYRCQTLLKVYAQYNVDYEKLYKAGMRSWGSLRRYRCVYRHLQEFLQSRYHVNDISLKELNPAFITDFEAFLRTDKHLCENSLSVYMLPLRTMVFRAIDNGWLTRDPFHDYKVPKVETTRGFLTKEEIHLLMNAELKRKTMQLIRDLYLFCCFTGLSFADLKNLKEEHIQTFFDDSEWIMIDRQKTGVRATIKLLDYPKSIMEKYRGLCADGRIFPVPCYSDCRGILLRVAKRCGITKHLTWHMSRHTMATEICLTNGVPIETVSSILGHKNIKTTQIYAKITKEKLNKDMDKLSLQLNHIEEYMGHVEQSVENDKSNLISKQDEV
ncbi:site-specific integrase [Prevotella sp.]|uniref:site-specific integrase n=1 Tax=Prevotella sp. TaxID=59823 RepID=UPI0025DAC7B2|nr:site-specific integrase [Prevotella sp.]